MRRTTKSLIGLSVALGLVCATAEAKNDDDCFYRGTMYSEGAQSCQQSALFRCNSGTWKATGSACTDTSPVAPSGPCTLSGVSYPTGASTCQGGTQYRCENGTWASLATACPGDVTARVVPGARTCMYEGATVASNSTICKSGSTYLCSDGSWVNLGTQCR
jgi:hypothetical protein